MVLTRVAGAVLAGANDVVVPMDGWGSATGNRAIRTEGVTDCLVMILHAPTHGAAGAGALAHLSWPKQSHGPGSNALNILQNTARVRDQMVTALGCEPRLIEAYLWRGLGFGPTGTLGDNAGNVMDLPWGHFAICVDMMAHGDFLKPGDTTPFRGAGSVSYNPGLSLAWFF